MADSYTFDFSLEILPTRGTKTPPITLQIDTAAAYGYFERHDGNLSGGLWFDPAPGLCERGLELADYDGVCDLAQRIVDCLRLAGFHVSEEYDHEWAR